MPTATVSGAEIYYESSGSGRPLLFVHGMCGNANVWDDQVRRLSDSCTCVTYDRRGHTRSTLGDITARTVELHADDAAALIRELGLAECVLVGSSGGARIGVDVVLRYPDRIAGAVLSEPPIFALDPEGRQDFLAAVVPAVKRAAQDGPHAAVDAFFQLVCPGLWKQLDASRRAAYYENARELFGDIEMPPYAPATDALARCPVRVTFVSGTESMPVFRNVTKRLADLMPNADLVPIAASGHVTYAEQPETFAQVVRSFVDAL